LSAGNAAGAEAIRTLTTRWLAAERARDVAALLELVTEDATFLMPGGRLVTGRDGIRALFEQFFAAYDVEHTATVSEVEVANDWGWSWGTERNVIRPRGGGGGGGARRVRALDRPPRR
jgi:uncharacterized protein (TIGR02246 family)